MASDSKTEFIQTPNADNSLITKKNSTNLFTKQSECSYVSCYCEENVYKLCQDVMLKHSGELQKCFVVFVSNNSRTVPLWRQRAGRDEDKLVIWDYHVVFLYHPEPEKCLVYDLDSELPFPTYVHKYVTETFRTDHILKPDYFRYFRVIPATEFLNEFASDRRHMKRPDGSWIKPPPNYPAITTSSCYLPTWMKRRQIAACNKRGSIPEAKNLFQCQVICVIGFVFMLILLLQVNGYNVLFKRKGYMYWKEGINRFWYLLVSVTKIKVIISD